MNIQTDNASNQESNVHSFLDSAMKYVISNGEIYKSTIKCKLCTKYRLWNQTNEGNAKHLKWINTFNWKKREYKR
jgi:hypothetical protein